MPLFRYKRLEPNRDGQRIHQNIQLESNRD